MPAMLLDREEYVEQAHFFRVLRERLADNSPVQEVLAGLREEILATTRLPMAIDFLLGELQLKGHLGNGMARLGHYFAPFQTFIISSAEDEGARLDFAIALRILEREAHFRASPPVNLAALFIYQFECLARNRLGYDFGMVAISEDPAYPPVWKTWISRVRFELGTAEFADLVYAQSEQYVEDVRRQRRDPDYQPTTTMLFDANAGRIARANIGKDPLYMFAALQRQLGYPVVPRFLSNKTGPVLHPQTEMRLQRMEARMALIEQEQRGGLDITKFYQPGQPDQKPWNSEPEQAP
ncbi:hypothetical protein [Planctomicrobium piriforme]|uniref:Uncharacterized protein n=1 Tax=Planctomicrobium piriforme TaxID=1576369 RepID=A0A1I3MSL0_9PLAN|nr:hypothetical protein [Planctomicrobium piriforme]SFI99686.1 hypothetical protein SAMN05421753_11489 [Planctomicrobium piriforme]